MSTKLFRKDAESGDIIEGWFDGQEVSSLVSSGGWSVCNPGDEPEPEESIEELSNEEIREVAELAGIEDYNKKRINTLKEEIKAMGA